MKYKHFKQALLFKVGSSISICIEIAVYVRGDDAGRVSPFATSIGMIAALTKYKYTVVELNNVNGGGK